MKKIFIGRGSDNQVRIKDDSDKVSRRQAVIEVSFLGKMRIHDTSTNGTFVNGKPVEKPNGTPVKRGDKVDFAHVTNLDWNLVRDPYKGLKIAVCVFVVVLIGLAALYFIYADTLFGRAEKDLDLDELIEDTIDNDEDEDTIPQIAPTAPAAKKDNSKKPATPKNDKLKPLKQLPTVNGDKDKKDGQQNGNDKSKDAKPAPDKNGPTPQKGSPNAVRDMQREKN